MHPAARALPASLLVLLLALSSLVHGALIPSRVAGGDYYIDEQRVINATPGASDAGPLYVRNLAVNLSLPIDSRLVQAPPSAQVLHDAYGNPYLYFTDPEPKFPYVFRANSSIHVSSEPLSALPSSPAPLPGQARFLRLTPDMSPDDPRVEALARQITANASTPFEKVARLAAWTHDYIRYDARFTDQLPDVRTILDRPQGVCTEYTLLFSAMARSLGYPTRFVSGYAYSSDANTWQGHSWAEVWLGEWVPADPTWLEVGSLDATHIPLMRTPESAAVTLSISAMVSGSGELQLERDSPLGAPAEQVHAVRLVPRAEDELLSLQSSSDTIPPGGRAMVWLPYPSSDYSLVSATLSSCATNGTPLLDTGSSSRLLVSAPNQTSYLFWLVEAPAGLDPHYVYHCPISIHTGLADAPARTLSVSDEQTGQWPQLTAALQRSALSAGGRQRVYVNVPPELSGQPVHLLEEQLHLQETAGPNGSLEFEFQPGSLGTHTLYVFSTRGDPVALTYTVGSGPAPEIELASLPSALTEGEPINLTLELSGLDRLGPGPLALQWSLGELSGEQTLPDQPSVSVPLSIPSARAGDAFLVMRFLSSDGRELLRRSQPLHVWAPSHVSVRSVRLQSYAADGVQVLLELERSGGAVQPRLVLRNSSWPIGDDNTLRLILAPGSYPITLSWTDPSGKTQQSTELLNISPAAAVPAEPSPLPFSSYTPYDVRVIPVLLFLALVFAGLMVAALYLNLGAIQLGTLESQMRRLGAQETESSSHIPGVPPADEHPAAPSDAPREPDRIQ
ncbi:Transglutaminase-like superfamily protein [uncultured archaeon]|nr:Transglutaminase-like superfamily protein [uncultured archaeon]